MNEEAITAALKDVKYPGFSRDIVSFGLVQGVAFEDGVASVSIEVTNADPTVPPQIKKSIEEVLAGLEGIIEARVAVVVKKTAATTSHSQKAGPSSKTLSQIDHIVAVASGKGGVGKSTFAVNLACAFDQLLQESAGVKVGLMDCDVYGPSVPLMIGAEGRPEIRGDRLVPLENFGIRLMSMGFLIDEDSPVVWRGPMVTKTIQQFALNVEWGELKIMIVDLPPGRGDAQLSLVQILPLSGAVIVTTPQVAAVNVARRGARMFDAVNVPLLGVVENMSYLDNSETGKRQYLFGKGGGRQAAESLETEFLGEVPLDERIRIGGDSGIPIVIGHPESPAAESFREVASKIWTKLTRASQSSDTLVET
ncbi:MAG: Mrp/NBP35 family ATP-binding protein [Opitutales bacterium]